MRLTRRIRWRSLVFLVVTFVVVAILDPANAQEQATTTTAAADDTEIVVDDYLASLSNHELERICHDRGFEMAPRADGSPLLREDYLRAAQHCLSLEDEISAVLAENPELAAELEVEVERMKQEKERLVRERDGMLAEMQVLQEQLEQAGMDLKNYDHLKDDAAARPDPASMTAEQVLKESLVQLYERVRRDLGFVTSILRRVLRPVLGALKLVWRYTKPIGLELYKKGLKKLKGSENDDDDAAAMDHPTDNNESA